MAPALLPLRSAPALVLSPAVALVLSLALAPGAPAVPADTAAATTGATARPGATADPGPAPGPAPVAAPVCGGASDGDFPLDTRIHGGPAAYPADGIPRSWKLDLANTTSAPCAGVHPVLVLTDRDRTLRPEQISLEFYDGRAARWRPVTFESTDEAENVGVFTFPGFPGFAVPARATVTVPVRLAFRAGTAPDEITVNAAVVQRRGADGEWIGQSDDYPLTVRPAGASDPGTDPGADPDRDPRPDPDPAAPDRPATPSGVAPHPPGPDGSGRPGHSGGGELAATGGGDTASRAQALAPLAAALALAGALLLRAGPRLRARRTGIRPSRTGIRIRGNR